MKAEPRVASVARAGQDDEGWIRGLPSAVSELSRRSMAGHYAAVGLIGAAAGLLLGSAAVHLVHSLLDLHPPLMSALVTGLTFGFFSAGLSGSLYVAMRHHHHQKSRWTMLSTSILGGLAAGTVSGAVCQIFFNGLTSSNEIDDGSAEMAAIVGIAASILVAALLGILLSRYIPNLSRMRGLVAGLLAALVSLLVIGAAVASGVDTAISIPIGLVALGGSLGTAMAVVESQFRHAVLEINWGPNDTTHVGLGLSPVTIGGGKDDVFIRGAPAAISTIQMDAGRIEHTEHKTGKRTALQDGDRLRINGLTMVIHTPAAHAGRTEGRSSK